MRPPDRRKSRLRVTPVLGNSKKQSTLKFGIIIMRKFVAVIGPQNSGKSTIIKSLTGCKTTTRKDGIIDESNQKCIFVIPGSPQELKLEQYINIQRFQEILDNIIAKANCLGLVMSLQPSKPRTRSSMEEYFQEVHNRHAFEMFAFPLNPIRGGSTQNVVDIQTRLNQFAPRIEQLDARRFAHINASRIQEISRILI